jgi:predicted Fe-S protein YdhL (DUF1289 family)
MPVSPPCTRLCATWTSMSCTSCTRRRMINVEFTTRS